MELQEFKETLLEFLREVLVIPEMYEKAFIERGVEGLAVLAPDGFHVLGPKVLIRRRPEIENEGDCWFNIRIFTRDHYYGISAVFRGKNAKKSNMWFGCTAMTRKPRAGEDWARGNDLPDGDFDRKTWDEIKCGILKYELLYLSKQITGGHWYKPQTDDVPVLASFDTSK